jgi:hypothetical protein
MKQEYEIRALIMSNAKEMEKILGCKIRNGQHVKGIRDALEWVLRQ